tara:strand:- start:279 stop:530 length:252 start_codon:yes stop_codon:yes gene_type:complete
MNDMNETPQIPLPFPEIDEENNRKIRKFLKRVGILSHSMIGEQIDKQSMELNNMNVHIHLQVGGAWRTFNMHNEDVEVSSEKD